MIFENLYSIMKESIIESEKSISEDARIHPKVGAILTNMFGHVLAKSYRGESADGAHCEYNLLNKASQMNIDLSNSVLFVTLEPCTARGTGKIPCAQRIVDSGIKHVFIGMLDPNPIICGRGETFLRKHLTVERYPSELVKIIENSNCDFINLFIRELLPNNSLYVSKQIPDLMLEKIQKQGLEIKSLPSDRTCDIDDIIHHCKTLNDSYDMEQISDIVLNARNFAYDIKYSNYDYNNDARSLGDFWITEFKEILNELNIEDISSYKTINVGCGNGVEPKELLSNVQNLTLVDISINSLKKAKEILPDSVVVKNCAENLKDIESCSMDVYISLRTYQSTFFNIQSSLREAQRILKPNGAIVISIANGFIDENSSIIPGLVIPKTNIVDKHQPFEITDNIRRKLSMLGFRNINLRTGKSEIYIFARKG